MSNIDVNMKQPLTAPPLYEPSTDSQQLGGQYPQEPLPPISFVSPMSPAPKYEDQPGPYAQVYNTSSVSQNVMVEMPNEEPDNNWEEFSDKNIRRKFVQKVYSILSLQLFFTFGLTAIVVLTPAVKEWVQQQFYLYFVAYALFLSIYITLVCCEGPRRRHPFNLILLTLFTVALSFMVAMICSFHKVESVLIAAGITAVCCTAVSLLSYWTKFDFTKLAGAFTIALLALIIMGACMVIIRTELLIILYAGLGTVVFILLLAYDTQLITGGKKYEISAEEYIFAALMLYVDIIRIFLFILRLVGLGGRR